MNPVYLVLIATLALGIAETSTNRLFKKFVNLSSVGFLFLGSVVPILLALTFNSVFKIEYTQLDTKTIVLIVLTSCIYFFGNKIYFQSYKTEEASTTSVLVMQSIVVSTIFGQLFLQEKISGPQIAGIILVLIAVTRINLGSFSIEAFKNILKPSIGKRYATIGAILYGLGFSLTKYIVLDINPHYYQLLDNLIGLPLIFLFDFKGIKEQLKEIIKPSVFLSFLPIIFLFFMYNKLKYIAFTQNIPLPVADALDNTVIFVILGIEFFIFKSKEKKLFEKLLISLIAFAGIILIGI